MQFLSSLVGQAEWLTRWSALEMSFMESTITRRGRSCEVGWSDEGVTFVSLFDGGGRLVAGVAKDYGKRYVVTNDEGDVLGRYADLRRAMDDLASVLV